MLAFVVLFGDVKDLDRKVVRASKRIKLTDAAVLELSNPRGPLKIMAWEPLFCGYVIRQRRWSLLLVHVRIERKHLRFSSEDPRFFNGDPV